MYILNKDIEDNQWKLPKTWKIVEDKFEDKSDKLEDELINTPIVKEDLIKFIEFKEKVIVNLKELLKKDIVTIEEFSDIENEEYEEDTTKEILSIEAMKEWKKYDEERSTDINKQIEFMDKLITDGKEMTMCEYRKRVSETFKEKE